MRVRLMMAALFVLAGDGLLGHNRLGVAAEFRGRIVDRESGEPLAARVYLRNSRGEWLFVDSAAEHGSAFPYREAWVPRPGSVDRHTTVSAHPFRIELPPGKYELTIERGKEYMPLIEEIELSSRGEEREFRIQRWVDMAERGWFSGETHVHRRVRELPNVMLAEDLNVAFPVAYWTTRSDQPPTLAPSPLRRQGPSPFGPRRDHQTAPIAVDETHVIVPRNTEYEVFWVGEKRHVLGAMFLLNHKSVFERTAPPVREIARQAHREGALIDLDKHSWPWSMMLVPIANVDLFELSNNSVWRTQFGFKQAGGTLPSWARFERSAPNRLTEWGWLNYGFEVYYALLNCGFRLAPSAGTASGVHPVPLGHSRVYVYTGNPFRLESWLAGLKAGRSFVTNGPMLLVQADDKLPGEVFDLPEGKELELKIESISSRPVATIEIVVNGEIVETIKPRGERDGNGAYREVFTRSVPIDATSWVAVRSIEPRSDGRKRFAHTAPWHLKVAGKPMRPKRIEVEYFIWLMERELKRNRDVLPREALAEFEEALNVYRNLLSRAD